MRYAGIDLRAALLRVLALAVAFAMALMWAAFVAEHAVYATGTGTGAKNVLLIQTDHEFFYGYGTERDPGIIRENYSDFQSRAVSFPNAKSVCPLCSPARRSVLTGVYPHQQGILENQGSREMYAGVETIYDIYLENGWDPDNLYFFGKTHYSGTLMDVDTPITTYGIQGWAQLGNGYGNPYRTAEYRQYLIENDYFGCEEQYTSPVVRVLADSLNVNGTPSEGSLHVMGDMGFISGNIFGVALTPKEYHEAYFLADMAKDSLRDIAASGQSEPFVMTVNIRGPHHPCYPTQEYVDLYTDENGVVGGGAGCLYGRKPCAVGRARGRVITEQRAYRKGARILHAPELCGEGTEKAIRPQEITIFAQKSLTNGAKKVKLKNSQVARHALSPQCLRLCRDV